MTRGLYRIIDVNLNRLKEALRVCEDISRFSLCDRVLTRRFKSLRHRVRAAADKELLKRRGILKERRVRKDVGKKSTRSEKNRKDFLDVYLANTARAKESLRVLEETTKLISPGMSQKFKALRFSVYELEKKGEEGFARLRGAGQECHKETCRTPSRKSS